MHILDQKLDCQVYLPAEINEDDHECSLTVTLPIQLFRAKVLITSICRFVEVGGGDYFFHLLNPSSASHSVNFKWHTTSSEGSKMMMSKATKGS